MGVRNDITKSRVLRVINSYDPKDGYITFSDIAKELFCDWATARKHVGKYEETRNAFLSKCEAALDEAEKKLFEVAKSDISALKYLLSTKGKHRGYGLPTNAVSSQTQNDYFGIEVEQKTVNSNGQLVILTHDKIEAINEILHNNENSYLDHDTDEEIMSYENKKTVQKSI
jgi:hypothetical protein